VYGAFCCVSHTPDHTLDGRELRFMSMLGELILDDLGAERVVEQLRTDLERLIESQKVEVAYQPIFDLRTNRCVGLEALARFPKRFPGTHETLRAARELGLNFELERLLISRAWDAVERIGPDQFLALNVTPGVLLELARRANERDDRDGLPLSRLVVEITEHAAIDSYSALLERLAPLRELGLRIAVDDAGAGYASLRHVLELRPDFIKLDRSLCNGIAADHARRVAASGLVMLARDLGAQVIAEGIECDEDLTAVRELGLDAAQGFLMGEPSSDRDAIDGWTLSPA
jgi:EAL domain-containing protein (putative c-di-GMP-specific phosphodiesterase class I)